MKDKPRIYFETCVLSELLGIENSEYAPTEARDSERDAIKKLWELYKMDKIVIVTSAETRRELEKHPERYKDQEKERLGYYAMIEKIPVTSGGKYGEYKYNEGKYGVSPNKKEVDQIIPNHDGKEMDIKHIVNFIDDSSMQYFITLERRLLNLKDILFQRFHIRIELPSKALMEIQDLLNRDLIN